MPRDEGPDLTPPFHCIGMDFGDSAGDIVYGIVDGEGRTLMWEVRSKEFVRELADIMNENKERLVKAWRRKARRRTGGQGS